MRVRQLRAFNITFDSGEEMVYTIRTGMPPGMVNCIDIVPTKAGALIITFKGFYFDPFDVEIDPDLPYGDINKVRPKKKTFGVTVDVSQLEMGPEDPVMQFLGKLNAMRQDDMTLAAFMAEEDPVG